MSAALQAASPRGAAPTDGWVVGVAHNSCASPAIRGLTAPSPDRLAPTMAEFRFCPWCASPLALRARDEYGGARERLRCTECDFTHWNNPTPVLAAVVELDGKILLARNAAWPGRMFALVTGFMEAGESPEEGIRREIAEETSLETTSLGLIGVYEFRRMNQIIVAYHAVTRGTVSLSPELAEYKLYDFAEVRCWPSGTGHALADFLRSRGHEPRYFEWPRSE
jgi:NAD+ diphosphatase